MTPIKESIINKKTKNKPIWLMRQAGRYLPEFRKIRKLNPNFINLCLNDNLSSKITGKIINYFPQPDLWVILTGKITIIHNIQKLVQS